MTGNYFCLRHKKTDGLVGLFSFDASDMRDTYLAYQKAMALVREIPECYVSVLEIPRYAGDWDSLPLARQPGAL